MKKLYFALVALMLCAISVNAQNIVYLNAEKWGGDYYAVWTWDDSSSKLLPMTSDETTGYYSADIGTKTSLLFIKTNSQVSEGNSWPNNNVTAQTSDFDYNSATPLFTITSGNTGTWSALGALPAPEFTVESGTCFEETLTFEITTNVADATIYYTTDGSDPTISDENKYDNNPITINTTTTVKAIAYVEGRDYSIATAQYVLGRTIYLQPKSDTWDWTSDGAWFAVYYWPGDKWLKMESVSGLGIQENLYKVVVPKEGVEGFLFVRLNPASTVMSWDNAWNQTNDLSLDENNLFTITSENTGTWSTFTLPTYHYIYVNDADYPVENLTFSAVSVSDESQSLTIGAVETGSWTITEIGRTFNKRFQYVANDANFKVSYSNGTDTTEISGSEGWSATHDWYVEITKDGVTGVNEIAVDENAPVEYFNFQGVRVANPEKGMYIRVQGGKATKVIL